MANPILFLNQPYIQDGLGTLTFTIPAAGIYNVKGQVTVPTAVATGRGAGSGPVVAGPVVSSGVSVVVNQNASPVYTSSALGLSQEAFQFKAVLNCATTDAITIVISSSTASDLVLNGVDGIFSVNQGI